MRMRDMLIGSNQVLVDKLETLDFLSVAVQTGRDANAAMNGETTRRHDSVISAGSRQRSHCAFQVKPVVRMA